MKHPKRQHRTQDQWHALITQCQDSGLSGAQFCRQHGVNYPSFAKWRQRLQAEARPAASHPVAPTFLDLGALSVKSPGWQIILKLGQDIELCLRQG